MKIRTVKPNDADQIAHIYNHYIKNSIVTFEEEQISQNDMRNRIVSIASNYPFLVIEIKNEILGYAYATAWKARSAYKHSAEITIYMNPKKTGIGLGRILFEAFIQKLKETELHVLVGGIALPNAASIALHEKFGFEKVAQFKEIGYKFKKWIDVGYWELTL